MFSAFTNSMKIPELRSRILYTLGLLFVARVGAHIPLPGIDPKPLTQFFADQTASGEGGLVGLYNMFTGGALLKGAVCALGIMPYISASIIFQLMTAVLPSLSRLQQEGDVGRQKLTQYTRYATVIRSETPLPMPRWVICSPSHMRSMVPAVMKMTEVVRKVHFSVITMGPYWDTS